MNTFKKFSQDIPQFYEEILKSNPDYIVPVERKGCKLIRLLESKRSECSPPIRYKQFFDNIKVDLNGKHIAVIDDASKYTSSLYEYRSYFEKLGAKVSTYSFVGQESLRLGLREKYDEEAKIFRFLNESTYQEYIIQQSIELSKSENSFDIDHLVFSTKIPKSRYDKLLKCIFNICEFEYINDVYTPSHISKFSCVNFTFPIKMPFPKNIGIYEATLIKIRFTYNIKTEQLSIVPLYYPTWDIKTECQIKEFLSTLNLELPYDLNLQIKQEGMYMNILYICNLYLLKTFLDNLNDFHEFNNLVFNNYDLTAYIGEKRVQKVGCSALNFLTSKEQGKNLNLSRLPSLTYSVKRYPAFNSIMSLMKHLRGEYERRLQTDSVLNVKYFLSFNELYSRYEGKANLIKWIDVLCDRGVMVTRNVLLNGFYCRACRSGEADYDHIERKSNALLPIIINLCGVKVNKTMRIRATLLNKIIANLAYDYPMDHHDFHNFFTKPYYYGPFSYAKNRLNDEIEIPLYDVNKISSFCTYDEVSGDFLSIDYGNEELKKELEAFSSSDLVPLAEIQNYIDFLYAVSRHFKKADSLNELIICRDQDIYYRHVHFDIISAYGNLITAYKNAIATKKERHLRDAAKIAKEAKKKLRYNQKSLFDELEKEFGTQLRYKLPYDKIISAKVDFDDSFDEFKVQLLKIVSLEQALSNIMLFKQSFNKQYLQKFINVLKCEIFIPNEKLVIFVELAKEKDLKAYDELYEKSIEQIDAIIDELYEMLCLLIKDIPTPRDSDYVLSNKKRDMEVAINKAIQHIRKKNLNDFTILHFDFSGYKNLDGSKAINIIEKVHDYVTFLMKGAENGRFMYGLIGSHTFGTVIFDSLENAISFSKKLKKEFLRQGVCQVEFKFGCCCCDVSENLYDSIKHAWNQASSCSKLSSKQKDHYAGFVISESSYLHTKENLKEDFMKIEVDTQPYYLHSDFESSESESVIQYETDTDENVRIGIITALTEEFVSMQKMLTNPRTAVFPKGKVGKNRSIGRQYCVGYIDSLDGKKHKVALTQTIGPGNTAAANRANSLLEHFPNLDIIIMTGIAGGIPDPNDKTKHVRLGDIVIASQIIPYDFVSEKASFTELRGRIVPPSARLVDAQNHLDTIAFLGDKPWEKYINDMMFRIPKIYSRPAEKFDVLYDYNDNEIAHPEDETRDGNPRVFKEKIASANRVLKNPKRRDELKSQHNVYAVEMEGAGIADATWEAEIGYYVIRGISDYCDGKKNDIWHNYAALTAAAYTRALIEKLPY